MHDRLPLARGFEAPAVVEIFERPVDVFDFDRALGLVQQHLRRESLADRLVADGHVGQQQHLAVALLARAHRQCLAERQECGIVLDIGNQIEHLVRGMLDDMVGFKMRHDRELVAPPYLRK
ncbi:hypothetical protein D9M72_569340 [compost metagenome]